MEKRHGNESNCRNNLKLIKEIKPMRTKSRRESRNAAWCGLHFHGSQVTSTLAFAITIDIQPACQGHLGSVQDGIYALGKARNFYALHSVSQKFYSHRDINVEQTNKQKTNKNKKQTKNKQKTNTQSPQNKTTNKQTNNN